jgi:hypothetical protein
MAPADFRRERRVTAVVSVAGDPALADADAAVVVASATRASPVTGAVLGRGALRRALIALS